MTIVEVALVCVASLWVLSIVGFVVYLAIRQSVKRRNFVARLNDHDKGVIGEYMNILWN